MLKYWIPPGNAFKRPFELHSTVTLDAGHRVSVNNYGYPWPTEVRRHVSVWAANDEYRSYIYLISPLPQPREVDVPDVAWRLRSRE